MVFMTFSEKHADFTKVNKNLDSVNARSFLSRDAKLCVDVVRGSFRFGSLA